MQTKKIQTPPNYLHAGHVSSLIICTQCALILFLSGVLITISQTGFIATSSFYTYYTAYRMQNAIILYRAALHADDDVGTTFLFWLVCSVFFFFSLKVN